jgi:hypothetical protein
LTNDHPVPDPGTRVASLRSDDDVLDLPAAATGVLMLAYWLDERSATQLLDSWASQRQVSVATVAAGVLEVVQGRPAADQLVSWLSQQLDQLEPRR